MSYWVVKINAFHIQRSIIAFFIVIVQLQQQHQRQEQQKLQYQHHQPIVVNITQGKTVYTATIIYSIVLVVFQRKKDNKSRNKCLSMLDSGTKILIKWTITGGKQRVEASSIKLVNDKEDEGSGRRSSSKQRR